MLVPRTKQLCLPLPNSYQLVDSQNESRKLCLIDWLTWYVCVAIPLGVAIQKTLRKLSAVKCMMMSCYSI